ncbi:MAG: DUF945 family protein [Marinospirillum sp.]|uniref:DUF945 family protein n=1 Tax=Marinospirillum sp. TaxID=2183934 RepID=UPI0019EBAB04|nr:DUF945 family protein [Marinospirillum sp.]MBE0505529.1 DUF945 family protein [Marinospirillum sp.]
MKKFLWILLLVLLVAGVAASITTGRMFHAELQKVTTESVRDPRIELVLNEVEEGLFSSSGQQTLAMNLDAETRLLIETRWQASHLPGWLNFNGDVNLKAESLQDGETIDLLQELGITPLTYVGKADWNKATYRLVLEPFNLQEAGVLLESSGLVHEGVYHYTGQQVGQLRMDHLQARGQGYNTSNLDLAGLLMTFEQRVDYPWSKGQIELTFESLDFSGSQGNVQINKPLWQLQLDFTKKAFDLLMKLDLGEVTSDGKSLAAGRLTLRTKQLDGQAMADLLEQMDGQMGFDPLSESQNQALLATTDRLLASSPQLLLEQLEFSLKAPMEFDQKVHGSLSFDGTNLPTDYLLQLSLGQLGTEDFFSRVRLELVFDQINPILLLMLGIPPYMVDNPDQEQHLLLENGELRLNGQLMPL